MVVHLVKRHTLYFFFPRNYNLALKPHETRTMRLFSSTLNSRQCKPDRKSSLIEKKSSELKASDNYFGRSSYRSQVKVILVSMGIFGSVLAGSLAYNKSTVFLDPWSEENKEFFKEKFGSDGYFDVKRMVGLFRTFKIRVLFDTRTDIFIFWCLPDKLDEEIREFICDSSNYKVCFPLYLGMSKYGKHQIKFLSKQDPSLEYQEDLKYRSESRRWWIGASLL
ncbi:MAG: hypothetical protein AAGG81_03625 [Chlamydiota bacterium]